MLREKLVIQEENVYGKWQLCLGWVQEEAGVGADIATADGMDG